MIKKYFLVFSLLFAISIHAQELPKTLNSIEIFEIVRNFHPIVRQSNINIEKSKADILGARGNFDPTLSYYMGEKTFNNDFYYKDISLELKIPAWYGIEIYAGIDDLTGNRLDPSQSVGKSNYVGINIPLAKNLLMDKRRAYLKQAKIFNSISEIEQNILINDLFMDAIDSYWAWLKAYQTYKIIENTVLINENRLELVKKSYLNGERPEIDITEATTQLLNFQYQKNENWLEFQNAGLQLSAFLWTENNQPFELPESVIPQNIWDNDSTYENFNFSLLELLNDAEENHPYLKIYNFKLNILEIDKKLKFQDLLPKIDFSYNFLAKEYKLQNTLLEASPFQNNYQFGIKAEVPLLLSQGRANYKIAKLKIEETILDQNQKKLAVQLKIKSYYNEFITLKNQVAVQLKYLQNYKKLVKAEEIRFENGESSLFFINSRENGALEAEKKLIELKAKYFKSIYAVQWSAGLLK
jgi:outer membrane protein TolC